MSWRRALTSLLMLVACQPPSVQTVSGPPGPGPGPASSDAGAEPTPPGGGAPPSAFPDAGPATSKPGPTCAQEAHTAERLPVDLLLLVDVSGSMDGMSGTQTKWQRSRAALEAFVKDPASTGLGVGLSFFPSKAPEEMHACTEEGQCAGISNPIQNACRMNGVCFAPGVPLLDNRNCSPTAVNAIFNCPAGMTCKPRGRCPQSGGLCVLGGEACPGGAADRCALVPGVCRTQGEGCNVTKFGQLDVDIGDLPGRTGAVVAALAAQEPDGSTPMALAADSALTALAARQKSQPQRRPVLVLSTDGIPSGCGDTQTIAAVEALLARARTATPSIPTYVVGVFSPTDLAASQPALERFAVAGGTRMPFILTAGDDLTQRLLAALNEIRKQSVACEYSIPSPQMGSIDFDRVNVRTSGGGGPQEPVYVTSADRCQPVQGGWYYDPPPAPGTTPTRLVLCPATCDRLRADPAARVELVFGCATVTIK
jgi:hypothetical protein